MVTLHILALCYQQFSNHRLFYISSKANTVADAISRLHDPAFCRTLKELFHISPLAFDRQRAQVSQSAFSSLPWQVQFILRSSYYRKNRECIATMPLQNSQQQVISRSYEHNFASVSSLAIPQFPVALFTSSVTLSSSHEHSLLAAFPSISTFSVFCTCSMATLALLKTPYLSIRKLSS